ncbi:MAG: DUF166 domain-containing protein [Armatimonadota bacterium]
MPDMRVQILHTGGHYPRFVRGYLKKQGAPVEDFEIEADDEAAMDDPSALLPDSLGECDVLIAIAVPGGILRALPEILADSGCGALIVPVEDPQWVRPGLQRQLERLCAEVGVECAVPTPFCALTPRGEMVAAFCDQYAVGRPRVDIHAEDGIVTSVDCHRSAPCGLTEWVAKKLPDTPLDEVIEQVKVLHHGRPCMASMVLVPERGDTLMHLSLDILKRAFRNALRRARGDSVIKNAP